MREKELNRLTIATVNTLFDGVSCETQTVGSWMALHAKTFAGKEENLRREQSLRAGEHPVELVLRKHKPQIIVINEVIRATWGSETLSLLDKYDYQHRVFGSPGSPINSLARNTMIASKLFGQSVEVPVSNPAGGHFCALHIEKDNILVVAVQASAFLPGVRLRQIRDVFAFCHQKMQEGIQVVVAGDFNCELSQKEGLQVPQVLSHLTKPTFPHPNLLKRINGSAKLMQIFTQSLLSLSGGRQRPLDHILVPSDWTVLSFDSMVTTSDHLGLVARVDFRSSK